MGKRNHLDSTPVAVDLRGTDVVAVCGDREACRALVRSMLCEVAVSCGPDVARVLVVRDRQDGEEWSWCEWLPHATVADLGRDSDALVSNLVQPRLDHLSRVSDDPLATDQATRAFDDVVVVLDAYSPTTTTDEIERMLSEAGRVACSVLVIAGSYETSPQAADTVIEVPTASSAVFCELSPTGRRQPVRPATLSVEEATRTALALAPLELANPSETTRRLESPGLFDVLGLRSTLDVEAVRSLRATRAAPLTFPAGVKEGGGLLTVDLREPSQGGPGHAGMIIGAAGYGKSVWLRTLVASAMLTHSVDELAFMLVDYKGGEAFDVFEALPHVAGIATDLDYDPALISRVQDALRGELRRRKALLRKFRRSHPAAATAIDPSTGRPPPVVASYQAWAATEEGVAAGAESLPTLIVVIDEFGELVALHPEIVDVLASICRAGRSLGVHFLFATQRVDHAAMHALEGYLGWRAAFRVLTSEDSYAVIHSRAAADLPDLPGAGLLLTGTQLVSFKGAYAEGVSRALFVEPSEEDQGRDDDRIPNADSPPPRDVTRTALSRAARSRSHVVPSG